MNSELAAIIRTMDYFIEFFSKALPDHSPKTDILTGKDMDELKLELNKDYEERRKYIEDKIMEFAKVASNNN